jgi:light-harvesting complex I chlorophyll a/b binding protein 4
MAATMMSSKSLLAGTPLQTARITAQRPAARAGVVVRAADRPLFIPGAAPPEYLDGSLAGDYGWDPLGLGADETARRWYRQSELQHARWAMLGVAGILVQEITRPDIFWYTAGEPKNLPDLYFGPNGVNLGGLLAWEFLLMHWVEVRRWQDYKNFGSVNQDPIFKGNSVPNPEMGYPGGIFDPFGFAKGDFKELQTKEIKNGRLAMVAFAGFTLQAQATGKGPLANLSDHLSSPFTNNITNNIGTCKLPTSVDVQGLSIPITCLWPGQHGPV